jgi:NAD-reducing hydrogenase small subunit
MKRPRVATVWLGGCSGCHMSLLDMDERLLDLAAAMDLVYSPLMDVKEFPEGVDVTLVEGAIANEDHVEMIQRVRERTEILVALGDCAVTGNVTALRNPLGGAVPVLKRVYGGAFGGTPFGGSTGPALQTECRPGPVDPARIVPPLLDKVLTLRSLVRVDFYLPGCPPSADVIHHALTELVAGRLLNVRDRATLG